MIIIMEDYNRSLQIKELVLKVDYYLFCTFFAPFPFSTSSLGVLEAAIVTWKDFLHFFS